ncbi:hypothetical protein QAD02_007973 [Eretmocerus hayati]|uniref:Uncharacterized protein n=1 Tax=Eretmocerus hayati TaxID=131215 RepID=A0ACC2N6K9_9HYME|nr:hypothetical protein QAD02_007973 [Eretmocerus hayati]
MAAAFPDEGEYSDEVNDEPDHGNENDTDPYFKDEEWDEIKATIMSLSIDDNGVQMFIRPNQPETPTPEEDNLDEDVIIGEVRKEDDFEDQEDDDLVGGDDSSRSPVRADEESAERANESRADEIREKGRQDRKLDCLQTSVSKLTNQVTNLLEVTTNSLKTNIRERKAIRRDINTQNEKISELSKRVGKYSKEVRDLRNRQDSSQSPARSSRTRSLSLRSIMRVQEANKHQSKYE